MHTGLSCTSQAYNSFISSPLIILQLWRIINNRHTLSCPVTPDALTVKGIPGDLTSHGWMQGAFTSPSNCDLDPQYSHSASRPQQRHYMDTTLFTHAQGGKKSPDSDSALGCVYPKIHRHQAAAHSN